MADNPFMQIALRLHPAINCMRATLTRSSRMLNERMRSMQRSTDALRFAARATQRRVSIVLGVGVERETGSDGAGAGDPYPIRCPRCGSPTRRIHRLPTDHFLSVFLRVWRFRCTDPSCGWEDPVRMRHTDFQRLS